MCLVPCGLSIYVTGRKNKEEFFMSTKLFTLGLRAAAVRHSGEEGSGMAAEKKVLAPGLYA